MRHFQLLVAALIACGPAAADDAPARLAAGYKALFTCSATFLAGRSGEQIARNDLSGIYRDYQSVMSALPEARIDMTNRTVSVDWSPSAPARIARYHPPLGCTILPVGAEGSMPLPSVTLKPLPAQTDLAWPAGDRLPHAPLAADLSGAPLSRVLAQAFDGNTFGSGSRSSAVVVLADGALIAEHYSADSGVDVPQRTWSVAKTIMGALIGIAAGEGLLAPEEATRLPQWSAPGDPRGAIRIVDLLHMASGLDTNGPGSRTDDVYFGGARVEETALTHGLVTVPGRRWNYANNDTLALSRVLRERIGDETRYLAWPDEKLFRRIGMRHTTAETDWGGTFILSSQVWTTARDLARFGQLLLDDGQWNGERILPAGWVGFMRAPAPVQPPARPDGSKGAGYGAQVWLFGESHGLPAGTFAAMGNRGQFIVVVPERRVVIVRRGHDPESGPFKIESFSAAILEALGKT